MRRFTLLLAFSLVALLPTFGHASEFICQGHVSSLNMFIETPPTTTYDIKQGQTAQVELVARTVETHLEGCPQYGYETVEFRFVPGKSTGYWLNTRKISEEKEYLSCPTRKCLAKPIKVTRRFALEAALGEGTHVIEFFGTAKGDVRQSTGSQTITVTVPGLVDGSIDGITMKDGRPILRGWACEVKKEYSIDVSIYAEKANEPKVFMAQTNANQRSEDSLVRRCLTNFRYYRWELDLSSYQAKLGGSKIYVVPNTGSGNLANNGKFVIPDNRGPVIGSFDGFYTNPNGFSTAFGWACDINVPQSIDVLAYLDGPVGVGQGPYRFPTYVASEAGVSAYCKTSNVAHRFNVDLTPYQKDIAGRRLYFYGVSASGHEDVLLPGSGQHVVPPAPVQ
ncbi:hypothetical protein [Chitinivorax sp. B]|uniref:hypothetical protein n=1 Tax=Chitinivorax sp. B TaxID=2502235 RepID=UPI0010F56EEE|nr:hypothetical protein [Chitinivorax sp. B]